MNKQLLINISGVIGGAVVVGWGLAVAISEGITLGSVLLLISGSGMSAKTVSIIQSNSTVLDDRLMWFTVAMVVVSIITAIWYLSLMG